MKESRKISLLMPMVPRYLVNQCYDRAWFVHASGNCSFTGGFSNNAVSHELILLGSGAI